MKATKTFYWTTTILLFLLEGVMPALTSNSEMAKEGIRHLGYPDYFRNMLTICKVLGSLILLLPMMKGRLKEWAYAGFVFDFLFAAGSHWAVDGFDGNTIFPLVALVLLAVSYVSYHKLNGNVGFNTTNNTGSLAAAR